MAYLVFKVNFAVHERPTNMPANFHQMLSNFWVIGTSYHNLKTEERGQFSLSNEQYINYLQTAKKQGVNSTFVLSTCNRTEIYCYCTSPEMAIESYCTQLALDTNHFLKYAYKINGYDAFLHLFRVSSGLDSQILGDYEIVGQMKNAFQLAKDHKNTELILDRIFNAVLQASRDIRTHTQLSSGTVSVAFAAAQFIKSNLSQPSTAKVLILGAGEIGRNTGVNLNQLLPNIKLTVCNRTLEKATALAQELHAATLPFELLPMHQKYFDAIIVATNSDTYILDKSHLSTERNYILIDLAVPQNINPNVKDLATVSYANVDIISKINDETLKQRALEIPKAEAIIQHHYQEFIDWLDMRKHVPIIKEVKEKLITLNEKLEPSCAPENEQIIKKAINSMASKLKNEESRKLGCNYIETFVEYFDRTTSNNGLSN